MNFCYGFHRTTYGTIFIMGDNQGDTHMQITPFLLSNSKHMKTLEYNLYYKSMFETDMLLDIGLHLNFILMCSLTKGRRKDQRMKRTMIETGIN